MPQGVLVHGSLSVVLKVFSKIPYILNLNEKVVGSFPDPVGGARNDQREARSDWPLIRLINLCLLMQQIVST